jgi:methionine synthase II (cobalamin-independent)
MATDYHAEHVGSLLRPPWLLDARARHQRGELDESGLRAAADRAAGENLALQRDAGLEIFTDGEVRRDKLTNVEAEYLASQVPGQFKITMMSAAMGGMVWHPAVSTGAYPSPAELIQDLVALQIEEIGDLVARGTRRVQLDSLACNQVFDDEFRAATGNGAIDPRLILAGAVAADAAVVSAVKAAHPRGHRGHAHLPREQPQRLHGPRRLRAGGRAAVRRGAGGPRRPGTCRPRTWPSARSAGSPPPRRATC